MIKDHDPTEIDYATRCVVIDPHASHQTLVYGLSAAEYAERVAPTRSVEVRDVRDRRPEPGKRRGSVVSVIIDGRKYFFDGNLGRLK